MLVQRTRGGTRSAASSGRRRPDRAIELTIDEYLQHVAERELHAGVVANRAGGSGDHHESAHRRDSRDGERADVQPERLSRLEGDERRNRAVQDLYEPGSTFKVVTASAALEENLMTPDDRDRCARRPDSDRARGRSRHPRLRRAVVHRRHRQVEQRRRDQDWLQGRHRSAERLRAAFRLRPGRLAGFPWRELGASSGTGPSGPTARWRRCRWAIRSASRRCRWSRPSARSPTAAEYVEPRVVRAVYRDNRRYAIVPKDCRAADQRRHRRRR